MDAVVCGLILRAVEVARVITETTSFWGSWHFGSVLTNIRGAVSYQATQNIMLHPGGYSEDTYRRETAATYEELNNDILAVVERLAGPLLRGFASPYELHRLPTS